MDYFIECAEYLSKIPKVAMTPELAQNKIVETLVPEFILSPLPHERKVVARLEFSIEPLIGGGRGDRYRRANQVGQFIGTILEALVRECEKQIHDHRNRDAVAWLYEL